MVAKPGAPYRSANAGELSPEAAGRVDIKQFYSAGLRFKNVEPVPLSGFRDMGGSLDLGLVRGRVSVLTVTGAAATPGPFTGTQTIWAGTIAGNVCAIDCAAIAADTGTHQVQAQVQIGASWVNLGSAIEIGTTAQAVTFAIAPATAQAAVAVRLRGIFSVPASITTGAVTVLAESATQDVPRYASLEHDSGARYLFSLGRGFLDVFEGDSFVAGVYLPDLANDAYAAVNFYAENATVGLAHHDVQTQRVRRSGSSTKWIRDAWPYSSLPKVDLGGVYTKTDDKWNISVTYTADNTIYASLSLTVDGETTPAIPFVDNTDTAVKLGASVDTTLTAARIKAALEALPSLGATITVVVTGMPGTWFEIEITFGGNLSGSEYQFISTISNTADAAALASHTQIGKTDYEPLFSVAQGWPGVFGFVQERLAYGDIKAVPPAVALSQAGEYFALDIEIAGPQAPRLDKLRGGQTSERVLAFIESTYFLVLTNRGVYFASNRTINATDPLNFVRVAEAGTVANCEAVMLENKVYYIGANPEIDQTTGHQLLSLSYSEIETTFDANPEHILASHLVEGILRCKPQKAANRADASKLWLMREDGRLIAACVIKSQDILGFCEFVLAAGGMAREIHVDASNALRACVERSGKLRHERFTRDVLFQAAVPASADLTGVIAGLDHLEGQNVWVEQDGYVEGPFPVTGGAVDLADAAWQGAVTVGLWQAPVWESMPRYLITRTDEVVKRPGRIHTLELELIATTNIAIGANGQPPQEVPLARTPTAIDQPPVPYTGKAQRNGMLGAVTGTTAVVTQVRPGRLQVRDMTIGEKL